MTDNKIIKALRCCSSGYCDTLNCPFRHIDEISECTSKLARESLDLINRQKAEIERMRDSDVVQVVRCKDCAYANHNAETCHLGVGHYTRPDRYCSEGIRKDDE